MGQCQNCNNTVTVLTPQPTLIFDFQTSSHNAFQSLQMYTTLPLPTPLQNQEFIEDFTPNAHIPIITQPLEFFKQLNLPQLNYTQPLRDQMLPYSDQPIRMHDFVYIGQWKYYYPYGYGIYYYDDGTIYQGISHNLLPNLYGRKYYKDGSIYEGHFKEGLQHGYGTFNSNNFEFRGQWIDNFPLEGTEIWPDGSQFNGTYVKGKKSGKGIMKWANGNEYNGQFKDDLLHGFGTYKFKDGNIYEGNWTKSLMNGYGKYIDQNGFVFEGQFKNGRSIEKDNLSTPDKSRIQESTQVYGELSEFPPSKANFKSYSSNQGSLSANNQIMSFRLQK